MQPSMTTVLGDLPPWKVTNDELSVVYKGERIKAFRILDNVYRIRYLILYLWNCTM